jgi:MFS family permease
MTQKSVELRNAGLYLAGESIWCFQMYMVWPATVLTMLLTFYGADKHRGMIGAISAIGDGAVILTQVFGVYLFHSRRKRKSQMLGYHFAVILPLMLTLAVAAWPGLPISGIARCWLLLGCFAAMVLSIGVIVPVWSDWLAHLFRREIRGRVMGVAQCAAALVGACGPPVAGFVIDRYKDPAVYAWLYAVAFGIAVVSIAMFLFVRDDQAAEAPETVPPTVREMFDCFRHSLRDANFRSFLIGRMLTTAGFCIAPFVVLYYHSAAGGVLSDRTILSCSTAQVLATAVAVLLLGVLGDRRGHRIGMIAGAAAQVLALGTLLTAGGLGSCLVAYACIGVCNGVFVVSFTNILFETCPHDNRMAHLTLGSLALAGPAIIAPLLAGQVAQRFGLGTLFVICLALSAAALLWFIFRTKEPRDLEIAPNGDSRNAGRGM